MQHETRGTRGTRGIKRGTRHQARQTNLREGDILFLDDKAGGVSLSVLPVLSQELNALLQGFRRGECLLDGDFSISISPALASLPYPNAFHR